MMLGNIERSALSFGVRTRALVWVMGTTLYFLALPAFAYIGPGAGISFLGSIVSTLVVIVLAIGAILFWPIRYMWRRMRRQKNAAQDNVAQEAVIQESVIQENVIQEKAQTVQSDD